jgi:hypothetical protein
VAGFREIKREVLKFGSQVEALSPEELRKEIRDEMGKWRKSTDQNDFSECRTLYVLAHVLRSILGILCRLSCTWHELMLRGWELVLAKARRDMCQLIAVGGDLIEAYG